MKEYTAANIRNVAFLGHGGDGKTTLTEAILNSLGLTDRMGRTEDGTTAMDFDPEEQKRGISISTSMAPVEWRGSKINILDIPGFFDMVGEMVGAMRVVEGAVILVNAVSGLSVGAEKAYAACTQSGVAKLFYINQMDRENASYEKALASLKDKYGSNVVALQIPIMNGGFKGYVDVLSGKAYLFDGKKTKECDIPADLSDEYETLKEQLCESAASADESLMEKYFEEGSLSAGEITKGLSAGVMSGELVPVLCGAALAVQNVNPLLDLIVDMFPAPTAVSEGVDPRDDSKIKRKMEDTEPFSALVFKTIADNFVGKISYIKVLSGVLTLNISPLNTTSGKPEKFSKISTMLGKKQIDITSLHAGDIGVLIKLQATNTSDTLCDAAKPIKYAPIDFPKPIISFAVSADKAGEEDKVFGGLSRLMEEDPTIVVQKDPLTSETIISGQGEMHIDITASKLKSKFNVKAALTDPIIPYRETIRKAADVEGRHKKQTGGHGQFGDCWIKFEPIFEEGIDFEFVDAVVGGVIPKQYIPAIEKGLRENIVKGVLAGYPVVKLRCTVHDGSYHPVDSSEMAFKTAARLAYKAGLQKADPVLLEPIMKVEVTMPSEYMGDIVGDLTRRRGRPMGMNPLADNMQQIIAEVPLAEMFKYATDLRSMTQARGLFSMEMVRYEEVPANIAQKIIANAKKDEEEEE